MKENISIGDPEKGKENEDLSKFTIRLEFFRHDEKDVPTTAGDRIGDETVRLTPQGRANSSTQGLSRDPNPGAAIAFGSNRIRTQETAVRQMLATEEDIDADDTLEQIEAMIKEQLPVGKKLVASDKLDFDWSTNREFNQVAYRRYLETKDALSFVYDESDGLATELHDKTSTTFTRAAANFAELVLKYVRIMPAWQRAAQKGEYGLQMQRFMGSHQDVVECFLLKIIEIKNGKDAVRSFIESMPDKNGFAYSEGYSVEIASTPMGETQLSVTFKDKSWTIAQGELEDIIKQRKDFDDSIVEA